jgi:hypothetical protein
MDWEQCGGLHPAQSPDENVIPLPGDGVNQPAQSDGGDGPH